MVQNTQVRRLLAIIARRNLIRIAAALVIAFAGGWYAFVLAASGIARIKSPQAALIFVPTESTALAVQAEQIYLKNPIKPSPYVEKLARQALKQQAMNPRALRLLGYAADWKGEKQKALALIGTAAKMSRRDSGAQIWLIEYYAQTGNTEKTLRHYDILLTTKPDFQTLLFPRLSNAIVDAPIRTALVPYMQYDRSWMNGFLWHAINGKDLTSLVSLIVEAKGFSSNDSGKSMARGLMGRLVNEKLYFDAQRIYRLLPEAKAARLNNPAFDDSDRTGDFGAMGWQIPDDPNAGGSFVGEKDLSKPALSVFANSSTTMTVASRLLYLTPGRHHFAAQITHLERGDGGYLRFQLRCQDLKGSLISWSVEAEPHRSSAILDVPPNCPVQFLDIVVSGGKGQLGMEAVISAVSITP